MGYKETEQGNRPNKPSVSEVRVWEGRAQGPSGARGPLEWKKRSNAKDTAKASWGAVAERGQA